MNELVAVLRESDDRWWKTRGKPLLFLQAFLLLLHTLSWLLLPWMPWGWDTPGKNWTAFGLMTLVWIAGNLTTVLLLLRIYFRTRLKLVELRQSAVIESMPLRQLFFIIILRSRAPLTIALAATFCTILMRYWVWIEAPARLSNIGSIRPFSLNPWAGFINGELNEVISLFILAWLGAWHLSLVLRAVGQEK